MKRWRCALVGAGLVFGIVSMGGEVCAQIARPKGAQREVRLFDFEERDVNLDDVPRFWIRTVLDDDGGAREGFPRWNHSGFDGDIAASGEWSVKIPTKGGSAGLRLVTGVIAAIPGVDYMISADVRTEGVTHSRARLTARFLDGAGVLVAGSETWSPLVVSDGVWELVSMELVGLHDDATWIQLEMELLQPGQLPGGGDGDGHKVGREDLSGAAWFDNLRVEQLPRVSLSTRNPTNMIFAPERPELLLSVEDLTGEPLRARIVVRDVDGRVVSRDEFDISWGGRAAARRPSLPAFGWYSATVEIVSKGEFVASRRIDFAWIPAPDPSARGEAERFGVIVERLPVEAMGTVPAFIDAFGAGSVTIPAVMDGEEADDVALGEVVESLLDLGKQLTFVVDPEHPLRSIADQNNAPASAIGLLLDENAGVLDLLREPMSRFGQRVRRWQIGKTGDIEPFWYDGLVPAVASIRQQLARRTPEPMVIVPWLATRAMGEALPVGVEYGMVLPVEVRQEGIERFRDVWPSSEAISMTIDLPDHEVYGNRAAVIDLVKKGVQSWRLGVNQIAIRDPWSLKTIGARPVLVPTPEAVAYVQLIERLSGRRVVAELPLTKGVMGFVLKGSDTDAIVAWSDQAENAAIHAYLADGPVTVVDPFGNRSVVQAVDGVHSIELTETPVFIEGVDVSLARFRAGFRIEPRFVPSTAEQHQLELVLHNPWASGISGKLRITDPEHWGIAPRVQAFSVEPGGIVRLPFSASFSVGEEAGEIPVRVEFDLTAERHYPGIVLTPTIELGLEYVDFSSSYTILHDDAGVPTDVVVTLVITNTGDDPLTMKAFAAAPGLPHQQAPVNEIAPTQTRVKRFIFKGAAGQLMGEEIRVSLVETDGLGRLNKTFVVR